MSKEEFIEKIKEIKINVPDEDFFLEYSKQIYNILDKIERLKKENFKLQARADKYKCRNDKAIEYIEENMKLDENSLIYVYEFDERKELLEILDFHQ